LKPRELKLTRRATFLHIRSGKPHLDAAACEFLLEALHQGQFLGREDVVDARRDRLGFGYSIGLNVGSSTGRELLAVVGGGSNCVACC